MTTNFLATYRKTKRRLVICSVLSFQEKEHTIEVSVELFSHVLLDQQIKRCASDLHVKLLRAFPSSSYSSHITQPIVSF